MDNTMKEEDFMAELDELVEQGLIERRGHGINAEYKLSDAFIEGIENGFKHKTGMSVQQARAQGMPQESIDAICEWPISGLL